MNKNKFKMNKELKEALLNNMQTFTDLLNKTIDEDEQQTVVNDEQQPVVNDEQTVVNTVETDINKEEQKDDKQDYFFKNILFFTNDRRPEKNKTLKNLTEAIKGTDIQIVTFVAEEVSFKADDKSIKIKDNETKYTINEQSNIDTICIVRLGAQDSEQCVECIREIQDWGIFTLNPIMAAKRASNKYSSSVLLERYNIPQPKFALLSKSDIREGEKTLQKKLKEIYPDVGDNEKEDKKKEYVVKILDGHGGTGVFMVTGKTILSILQAIFAIDEERELLLQKKEEADGGDIRVHVLTGRTKQTILASMKRVKISGDFRSNVSLGASAEKVELTKEQEEIALNVAKISGMPWCAVDIMPLVKDSNPEIGDNVVLEYNASPGTDGISEVIGENFCKLLLDAINDINELVLFPKSVGYIEDITLTMNGKDTLVLPCKLDTGNGAKASTIGCDELAIEGDNVTASIDGKRYNFKKFGQSNAIVGTKVEERVTVIIPCIQIGTRKLLNVEFALVDNRKKSTKILINRDIMRKLAYNINPQKQYLLKDELGLLDIKSSKK